MANELRKISVRCSHCGNLQQEPAHVLSTYCRACGEHFTVAAAKEQAAAPAAPKVGFMTRLVRTAIQRPPRKVRCYACGNTHEASGYAASTICPHCSGYIDLRNVVISNRTTRVVDTRGHLHIERAGFLNNASTICGSALIEGQINGRLYCDDLVRLSGKGRCGAEFSANKIVVEKTADLYITHPLRCAEALIRGHVAGRILCSGTVRVFKTGLLEGDVHAKAFTVDKGGAYQGNISIGRMEPPHPPTDHPGVKKGFLGPTGLPSELQTEFPLP